MNRYILGAHPRINKLFQKSWICASLMLVFLLINQSAECKQLSNEELNKLTKATKRKSGVPAIAVAVIRSDAINFGIAGTHKKGSKKKVTLKNKFHLGSNTKAITSLIAMKLIEQGAIKLQTSLYELFPELTNDEFKQVTLGDFLSHRARVMTFRNNEFESLGLKGSTSDKRYQLTKYLLKKKPLKEVFNYSNAGYVVAALMLEKAAKQSYEQLLDKTMHDLKLDYFIGFPNKQNKDNPWGHQLVNGRLKALKPSHHYKFPDYMVSAGDIAINIQDYAKFIQLHLQGLRGKDNYLLAKDYQTLHYGKKGYAYGWANQIDEKTRSTSHFGSLGTYFCYTVIMDEADIAVVFMLNSIEKKHVKSSYKLVAKIIELTFAK